MAGRRRSILALCLLTSCLVPTFLADASETITYSYDARGRLVQVGRSGSVNDGVQANYSYDKADNRTNVTVVASGIQVLSVNDVAASEGSSLAFTVTRAGPTDSSISVNYATSDGTATAGSDYAAASGTLNFATGETTQTVNVTTTDDAAVESAETVSLTLSGATGGATIGDAQGVGAIDDNDNPPSFSISDVSVTEGGDLVLTVTKTGSTSGSFSVTFATADGTATVGSDYTAASGTLTFDAADTTKTITIATTNDAAVESPETVLVNLSGATGGATITDAQGVGTINDNDNPPPSFSINSASAAEGLSVGFTVTKSGTATGTLTVDYATSGGTATSGTDFTETSGTLTFLDTQTTHTISVPTTNDTTYESNETFTVTLSNASGGSTIGTPLGTGTINNDDPVPPSFSINDVSVNEGNNIVLTVTKTGSTSSSFSVNYATANGTATAPSDYAATSGTLTFTSAETAKTITITTVNDTTVENNETVRVNLSGATGGATITDTQGIGTLISDDVGFSINDGSTTEGGAVGFTVTKAGATGSTTSVNYATANGTATLLDYYSKSGTLTFLANETSKSISVNTKTDEPLESSETFKVNLSGASGGTITDSQGIGTIIDEGGGFMSQPAGGEGEAAPTESEPAQGDESEAAPAEGEPPPDGQSEVAPTESQPAPGEGR